MIPRTLFTAEHDDFRKTVRRFFETEVVPHREAWDEQQHVDRAVWNKAGELGLLCATMPEQYGGLGVDRTYSTILMEEQSYAGDSGVGFALHSDIVAPYINNFGTHDQKAKYLPKLASGEMIGAIAMTEPGTGSDLQAVKTTAVLDGDDYVLNGSKIFITNGYLSDLVIVVAKTGNSGEGAKDISLLIVEASSPGFTKGKPLKKVGMKAQDTCELFFNDVKVPTENLLGVDEGQGFFQLMSQLPQERLNIAVQGMATIERALELTIAYVKDRKAFGQPIGQFQNTQFKIAELASQIEIGQAFVDKLLAAHVRGEEIVAEVSMAKWWTTDLQRRISAECLQLFGGYGFMDEYPISQDYADAAVQTIYGGTNEIMKVIIARKLGLG